MKGKLLQFSVFIAVGLFCLNSYFTCHVMLPGICFINREKHLGFPILFLETTCLQDLGYNHCQPLTGEPSFRNVLYCLQIYYEWNDVTIQVETTGKTGIQFMPVCNNFVVSIWKTD